MKTYQTGSYFYQSRTKNSNPLEENGPKVFNNHPCALLGLAVPRAVHPTNQPLRSTIYWQHWTNDKQETFEKRRRESVPYLERVGTKARQSQTGPCVQGTQAPQKSAITLHTSQVAFDEMAFAVAFLSKVPKATFVATNPFVFIPKNRVKSKI